jgi:putative acetyltransferase
MFKNYTIDKLNTLHHPEIMNVWESSVRATHHFLGEADIQAYKSIINGTYLRTLRLFGVKKDGNLLGFIGVGIKTIRLLFVLPATRSMGIGLALVNFVYQHFHIREVDVNEQNTQAYDFYRHLGFVVTERSITDAIGKPFPVLSMKLPINGQS